MATPATLPANFSEFDEDKAAPATLPATFSGFDEEKPQAAPATLPKDFDQFDDGAASKPAATGTISAYRPSNWQRIKDYAASLVEHAHRGESPSGAPLPGMQTAGHLGDTLLGQGEAQSPFTTEARKKEIQAAPLEAVKDVTGARGYPQMARGAKHYVESFSPEKFSTEGQASAARTRAGSELVQGAGEAMTPLLPVAATAAPLRTAAYLGAGYGLSEGGGAVAEKLGASPETTQLTKDVLWFLPSALAEVAGARAVFARGENGASAGRVSAFGDRVGAGFENTPESFRAAARAGKAGVGVDIPKESGAQPAPAPEVLPPASAAQAAAAHASADATAAMARHVVTEKMAADIVAGKSPAAPAPQPPPETPISKGTVTPELLEGIAQAITSLPQEARPQAMMEAHERMTAALAQQGRVIGPDGQLHLIENPKQAAKLAQGWMNDKVAEIDQRNFDLQKEQEKAAAAQAKEQSVTANPKSTLQKLRAAIERASVGAKQERVVEESRATINKQVDALKQGNVDVVFVPAGSSYTPKLPDGFKRADVDAKHSGGGTYFYNGDAYTAQAIKQAAKEGRHGELLGHVQSKADLVKAPTTVVVQARAKDGTPIQDSEVDASKPAVIAQQAQVLAERHPQAEIAVKPTHEVIGERMAASGEQAKPVADFLAATKKEPVRKGDSVRFVDRDGQERTGRVRHINELAARIAGDDGKSYEVAPSKIRGRGYQASERIAGSEGHETELAVPSGKMPAKYRVVEAKDLKTSHDAMSFAPNAAYPAGVQERTYHTSKEAQNRVIQQAQNYEPAYTVNTNPDAVNGPPVVTPDGVVLGGNSRAMSTRRLYESGGGGSYREHLKKSAAQFGVKHEDIYKLKQPVLVREVAAPKDHEAMRRLGSELNKSMTGALGVNERAVSAGKSIRPETFDDIVKMMDAMGFETTLREFLQEHGSQVLKMLEGDGVITERERPQFADTATGGLSPEGRTFVERALLGSVIDDPVLMERTPRAVLEKLGNSVGDLAVLKARSDDYNILPVIRTALEEHADLAQRGLSAEDFLRQRPMFGEERNPLVDAMVRTLALKPRQAKDAFRQFTQDAKFDVEGQGTLGLAIEPDAASAFNSAFNTELSPSGYERASKDAGAPAKREEVAFRGEPKDETRIERRSGLSEEEKQREGEIIDFTTKNFGKLVDEYIARNNKDGQLTIVSDNAKELLPHYGTKAERLANSETTHPASAAIAEGAWRKAISERVNSKKPQVMFVTGMQGSGKTTAIANVPLDYAGIVYERSLADKATAERFIKEATSSGRVAAVHFIYTKDPTTGLDRAITRAKEDGRTVNIRSMAKIYAGVPRALDSLRGTVPVFVTENTADAAMPRNLDVLKRISDNWSEERVYDTLRTELDRKHAAGEIDDQLYRSFLFDQSGSGEDGRALGGSDAVQSEEARGSNEPLYRQQAPVAPTFYSKAERAVEEKLPNAFSGEQALATLKAAGVKADELKWAGLDDLLKSKAKLTKQEVLEHLRENNVQVKEVLKGEQLGEPTTEAALPELNWEYHPDINPNAEYWEESDGDYRIMLNRYGTYLLDRISYNGEDEDELVGRYGSLHEAQIAAARHYRDSGNADEDETSGRGGDTQFSSYQLPGGENYRELLLTLPDMKVRSDVQTELERLQHEAENGVGGWTEERLKRYEALLDKVPKPGETAPIQTQFRSGHFNEPNVLAHVRFNDRVDAEGKGVLFLEEVQSDWHQKGRRSGYKTPETEEQQRELASADKASKASYMRLAQLLKDDGLGGYDTVSAAARGVLEHIQGKEYNEWSPETVVAAREYKEVSERAAQLKMDISGVGKVPDAPFKTTWHELALKRMLRYAAENGYDKLAWTPGDVQNDRYDLSKRVSKVQYHQWNGQNLLTAYDHHGKSVISQQVEPDKLADYIGKDAAEKLLAQKPREGNRSREIGEQVHWRELSGLDLKVGGSGMKGFYDKIIPEYLNKYGKKWGAKVEEAQIPDDTALQDYVIERSTQGRYSVVHDGGIVAGPFRDQGEALKRLREIGKTTNLAVPAMPITPEMKKSVMEEGQPLFRPEARPLAEELTRSIKSNPDVWNKIRSELSASLERAGEEGVTKLSDSGVEFGLRSALENYVRGEASAVPERLMDEALAETNWETLARFMDATDPLPAAFRPKEWQGYDPNREWMQDYEGRKEDGELYRGELDKAKSVRIEEAPAQLNLAGGETKMHRVFATDEDGLTLSYLVSAPELRVLQRNPSFQRAVEAGQQDKLFTPEQQDTEITGSGAKGGIVLPPQESEGQKTLFRQPLSATIRAAEHMSYAAKERDGSHYLLINQAARDVMGDVVGSRAWSGISLDKGNASAAAEELRNLTRAPNIRPETAEALEKLAGDLEAAVEKNGDAGVPLILETGNQAWDEQTVTHELVHAWQRRAGEGSIFDHVDFAPLFETDAARIGIRNLQAREPGLYKGMSDSSLVAEVAAHILNGELGALGINEEQAVSFVTKYAEGLAERHGDGALKGLPTTDGGFTDILRKTHAEAIGTRNPEAGPKDGLRGERSTQGKEPAGGGGQGEGSSGSARGLERLARRGSEESFDSIARSREAGFAKADIPIALAEGLIKAAAPVKEFIGSEIGKVRQSRALHEGIYSLESQFNADVLRAKRLLETLPGTAADEAAIYHHLEDPDKIALTAKQQQILDGWVVPLMDEAKRIYAKLSEGGMGVENYVHRQVRDRGGLIDRIMAGGRGSGRGNVLSKSAPSMKSRTLMALEDAKGNRTLVSIKEGKVRAVSQGGVRDLGSVRGIKTAAGALEDRLKPIDARLKELNKDLEFEKNDKERKKLSFEIAHLTRQRNEIMEAASEEDLKGQVFTDRGGNSYKLAQATTKEIEAQTDVKYFHNAMASAVANYLTMRRAERAFDYLESFKNSPEFSTIAVKRDQKGPPPKGWRPTQLQQFSQYVFEPHTAEVLDWYATRIAQKGPEIWDQIGRFLKTSIFFNPLIHVPNITVHWLVEKGLTGYADPRNWPNSLRAGVKAVNAVIHQNDDFLAALDAGGPLQSQKFETSQFAQLFFEKMANELDGNKESAFALAKAFGYANPAKLVKAIYEMAGKVTWWTNDLAFLQAAYEKTLRGMTLAQALKETGKHIPDYRLPTRILNNPSLSKLMSNPNLTMFGAYHYGALKSYAEMMKSALGVNEPPRAAEQEREPTPGERVQEVGHGWDLLMMAGLFTFVIYPQLDKLAKWWTSDDRAEFRRAGASTFLYNLVELAKGEKSPTEVIESVLTPAVHTVGAAQLALNRDFRTGHKIYDTHAPAKDVAKQVAGRAAEMIAPASAAERAMRSGEDMKKVLYGFAGIGFHLHGAEKLAAEIAVDKMGNEPQSPEDVAKRALKRDLLAAARKGDYDRVLDAEAEGKITSKEAKAIRHDSLEEPLLVTVKNFSAEELVKVYNAATDEQKELLEPLLQKKLRSLGKRDVEKAEELETRAASAR